MVVVGRADDDGVELVAVAVEGLAEIAAGERLPVDAEVISGASEADLRLVTGHTVDASSPGADGVDVQLLGDDAPEELAE